MPLLNRPKITALSLFGALLSLSISSATAQQAGPRFELGVGWSALHLDDIEFTAVTDLLVTEVLDHQSDHDGQLNGYKFTGELSGLVPHRRGDWLTTVAVKGFYARYEDDQNSRCVFTDDTDCVYFPLVDPDPDGVIGLGGGADASGGFFSDWQISVNRKAVYWGAAVELNFDRDTVQAVSFKDAPAPSESSAFQWRGGLSLRRLTQKTSLFSEDFGPTLDPVTLDDDLGTSYYGGYFGFTTWKPLGEGLRLKLGGETGLYYADTDYRGAYSATANLGDDTPLSQSLALSDSAPAFIGSLNIALERNFGTATLALFGEAEWLSYAPKVLYNDTDLNGGVPFDIVGFQNGTELGDGSAFSYTIGAKVSMPLQ